MLEELNKLREEALSEIRAADSADTLEKIRTKHLGRKGTIRDFLAKVPKLDAAERPVAGKQANDVKNELAAALDARAGELSPKEEEPAEAIDITLPGPAKQIGTKHPITQIHEKLVETFVRLGFESAYGPEIEDEYHNFDALNIPPDHPSRDGFDTFYLVDASRGPRLLRSHTSPVQVRVMESRKPPIRIIVPGKVFRPDTADASHSPMFHQLEGLCVDEGISFADLKAILGMAMQELFGPNTKTRFRPSFFPFTEPSAEVDVSCPFCAGKGCSVCKQSGWIEILGAGMVNPAVFRKVGYDIEKYTGFAFGIGVDRVAMLLLGVNDIRLFYENDARFLKQF